MHNISRIWLLKYGFMALPLAFAGLPLYIHMPVFYTGTFAMDIGILGIVLLCIRMFDAVQDPIIGYVCDRFNPYRSMFIIGGMGALMLGLGGLSTGPVWDISVMIWFSVCMVLATTGFSIVSINLNTIGGLWHTDKTQTIRISAWREAFGLIGLILASILPTILQQYMPIPQAFVYSFIVFVILSVFAMWGVLQTLQNIPTVTIQNNTKKIKYVYVMETKRLFNRSNVAFFGICGLAYVSASLPAVLVLFFIEHYLHAMAFAGVFLMLYFVSGAVFMGAWIKMSHNYGAMTTWQMAMIVSVVTFFSAVFLQSGDVVFYGIICIASGMALGADIALPPAIIANRINRTQTQQHATKYYAVLAFLSKTALALSAGVAFVVLGGTGFDTAMPMSDTTTYILLILYTAIPCGIRVLAVIGLSIFKRMEAHYG